MAADTQATVDQVLDLLLDTHGVAVGAVYRGPEFEALAERNIEAGFETELRRLVRVRRLELERGLAVAAANQTLVPVARDGQLLGILYLRTDAVDQELLAEAARSLVGAFSADENLRRLPARNLPADAERDYLLQRLELHEWNIARVARELGITRTTVYARMKRLDIPREKVPKTRRARTE